MTPDEIAAVKVEHEAHDSHPDGTCRPPGRVELKRKACDAYRLAVEAERLAGKMADAERRAVGWQRTAEIRARGWDAVSDERKILAGKVTDGFVAAANVEHAEALYGCVKGCAGCLAAKVRAALADQSKQEVNPLSI